MAVIVKTVPVATTRDTLAVAEPPFKGARPAVDDVAYLWVCETEHGEGLAWRGRVRAVAPTATRHLSLSLADLTPSTRRLGVADLRPLRDSTDDGPAATLAGKLYRHAHRKIAALTPEESAYLDGFFSDGPSDQVRAQ